MPASCSAAPGGSALSIDCPMPHTQLGVETEEHFPCCYTRHQWCMGKGSVAAARSTNDVTVCCYQMRKAMKQKCFECAMTQLLCRGIAAKDSQDLMCTHDCNP